MTRCLLIVDDEPDLLQVVPLLLPHYAWMLARDGQEALELMYQKRPDLALLDIVMPRMSGIKLIQAMKVDPVLDSIPIIILSALGQQREIEAGLQAGASRFVLKPFDGEGLGQVIQDVLKTVSTERA